MQIDGSFNVYRHYVNRETISFVNICDSFYKPSYKLDKIWVSDLNIGVDFILGLDFLLQNNGSCHLSRDEVVLSRNMTQTPVTTIYTPKFRYLKNNSRELDTNDSIEYNLLKEKIVNIKIVEKYQYIKKCKKC